MSIHPHPHFPTDFHWYLFSPHFLIPAASSPQQEPHCHAKTATKPSVAVATRVSMVPPCWCWRSSARRGARQVGFVQVGSSSTGSRGAAGHTRTTTTTTKSQLKSNNAIHNTNVGLFEAVSVWKLHPGLRHPLHGLSRRHCSGVGLRRPRTPKPYLQ